jgi:hypothetical protein
LKDSSTVQFHSSPTPEKQKHKQPSGSGGGKKSKRTTNTTMQQQQEQGQQHDQTTRRKDEYAAAQRAAVESVLVGRATAAAVQQQGEQLQRAEDLADETRDILNKANRTLRGMTSWSGWVSNILTPTALSSTASGGASSPSLPKNRRGAAAGAAAGAASDSNNDDVVNWAAYEQFPAVCQPAAQAVRNYHANLSVLAQCETEEQKVTCMQICDSMYTAANRQLLRRHDLTEQQKPNTEAYRVQIKADLEVLRKRQVASQKQVRGLVLPTAADHGGFSGPGRPTTTTPPAAGIDDATTTTTKAKLFGRPPESGSSLSAGSTTTTTTTTAKTSSSTTTAMVVEQQEQDQHLNFLAATLGELGHIANSLNEGLSDQHSRLDSLDTKSENVLATSKLVGRRTDRLIQKKSWTTSPPVFCCHVTIRHVDSGKYLTVMPNNKEVWLINQPHPQNAKFRVYKRQQQQGSSIFGLQCEGSRLWLGQHWMTGSLTCAATSFGRREEWQADDTNNWQFHTNTNHSSSSAAAAAAPQKQPKPTRLLCASAGWGQGGYLHVNEKFETYIGGGIISTSTNGGDNSSSNNNNKAAQWLMINNSSNNDA